MGFDLTTRADLEEVMDSIESYETYRRCLLDLDLVSRLVMAYGPTLKFIDLISRLRPVRPLRILDVACGDGSMLRRIAAWARQRRISVHLTGVDLNPRAIRVAEEFRQPQPPINYVVTDVFDYRPEACPDVILSSHFTHHLSDDNLVRFLLWMEGRARLGWFINDLHRHRNPYRLFRVLGSVAGWHPVIVSDGLLSIRRAFTVSEWERLLGEASISGAVVAKTFPGRITVASIRGLGDSAGQR